MISRLDATNTFRGVAPTTGGTNTVTIVATDPSANQTVQQYEVDVTGGSKAFTYDANGNVTDDGSRTLEWDSKNQLVAANSGSFRVEYFYDGMRRRVHTKVKENNNVVEESWLLWCGNAVCEERNASGNVTKRHLQQGDQIGTSSLFFAHDHLGSITQVSDNTASVVAAYAFDPSGRRALQSGTDAGVSGYTGHDWQPVVGVWLTMHRVYDPELGRWLSEDPIGLNDGPNLYAYVSGRPINRDDPLGLQSCCEELETRRRRLHEILDQWERGESPTGTIGGATVCAGNEPSIDIDFIRRRNGPCLAECSIAHENRHAEQCRRFGAETMGANWRSMERSAYLVELGCVIRKLRETTCGC